MKIDRKEKKEREDVKYTTMGPIQGRERKKKGSKET